MAKLLAGLEQRREGPRCCSHYVLTAGTGADLVEAVRALLGTRVEVARQRKQADQQREGDSGGKGPSHQQCSPPKRQSRSTTQGQTAAPGAKFRDLPSLVARKAGPAGPVGSPLDLVVAAAQRAEDVSEQ